MSAFNDAVYRFPKLCLLDDGQRVGFLEAVSGVEVGRGPEFGAYFRNSLGHVGAIASANGGTTMLVGIEALLTALGPGEDHSHFVQWQLPTAFTLSTGRQTTLCSVSAAEIAFVLIESATGITPWVRMLLEGGPVWLNGPEIPLDDKPHTAVLTWDDDADKNFWVDGTKVDADTTGTAWPTAYSSSIMTFTAAPPFGINLQHAGWDRILSDAEIGEISPLPAQRDAWTYTYKSGPPDGNWYPDWNATTRELVYRRFSGGTYRVDAIDPSDESTRQVLVIDPYGQNGMCFADGDYWAIDSIGNNLRRFTPAGATVATITFPDAGSNYANFVLANPDESAVYVSDGNQGKIFRISTATNTITHTYTGMAGGDDICFMGNWVPSLGLVCAHEWSGRISFLDPSDLSEVKLFTGLTGQIIAAEYDPISERVFYGDFQNNILRYFDYATGGNAGTITCPGFSGSSIPWIRFHRNYLFINNKSVVRLLNTETDVFDYEFTLNAGDTGTYNFGVDEIDDVWLGSTDGFHKFERTSPVASYNVLAQDTDNHQGSDVVTASLSPAGTGKILLALAQGNNNKNAPDPTSITGLGLTWNKIQGPHRGRDGGITRTGLWLYEGVGVPTSGAITIDIADSGADATCCYVVVEFPDAVSIPQSDGYGTGDASTTNVTDGLALAAFQDGRNGTIACVVSGGSGYGWDAAPDGFTLIATEVDTSYPYLQIGVYYKDFADIDPRITRSIATNIAAVAAEIGG